MKRILVTGSRDWWDVTICMRRAEKARIRVIECGGADA